MKEKDLLAWIIAVAEQFGWRVYHVPAPMQAVKGGGFVGAKRAAGLPDLFLLHDDPPRLVIAEVKGDGGKLSDAQKEFLQLARNVADPITDATNVNRSVGVYAWTPADQDLVEQILKSRVLL